MCLWHIRFYVKGKWNNFALLVRPVILLIPWVSQEVKVPTFAQRQKKLQAEQVSGHEESLKQDLHCAAKTTSFIKSLPQNCFKGCSYFLLSSCIENSLCMNSCHTNGYQHFRMHMTLKTDTYNDCTKKKPDPCSKTYRHCHSFQMIKIHQSLWRRYD